MVSLLKFAFWFVFLIIFLSSGLKSFGCVCTPPYGNNWKSYYVKKGIERSDLIFIGEVFPRKDNKYAIKVLDIFKGKIEGDTVFGGETLANSCTLIPEGGIWIIYTNLINEKYIDLDMCGLSRSLSNMDSGVPPPPILVNGKIDYNNSEQQIEDYENRMLPKNINNWINEYSMLIAYRNQNQVEKQKQQEKDVQLIYLSLSLGCISLLVSIFSFVVRLKAR